MRVAMAVFCGACFVSACGRPLTPLEMEERRAREARYAQANERRAQREAALHAYCLEHPIECERAEQGRRNAVFRALFGPDDPKPYPAETRTMCTSYGVTAECTTTRR